MAETVDDTKTFVIELIAEPGEGQIVNLDYPATVKHGAEYDVNASTKNIGAGSGKFVMEMYVDRVLQSKSAEFTLAAGETSTDKIPAATAPATGSTIPIEIKCIRIT